MVLLGVLLVAVALGGGALLFYGTSSLDDTITIPLLGGNIELPPLALFIAGIVSTLLLWIGWSLLRAGARRSARQRREAKENARLAEDQRRQNAEQLEQARREADDQVAAERARAEERLADQRLATETARRRAEVAEERGGDNTV